MSKPIKNFLKSSSNDKEDFSSAIDAFNAMRSEVLLRPTFKDDPSRITKYYDQVHAVEQKLPISENQIRIQFKWQDALSNSGSSLFSGKNKVSTSWKIQFEKASVLWNVAHAFSEQAAAQNLTNDEQMKLAVKLFQTVSGIFSFLKDYVSLNALTSLSTDFEPSVLNFYSWLMLAQAAEIIYMKSTTFPDSLAAPIAAHVADCYKEAHTLSKTETAKRTLPDNCSSLMIVKHLYFQSKCEVHAAKQASQEKKFGLQLARLNRAKDLAEQSVNKAGTSSFSTVSRTNLKEITQMATTAEKDNNFIYHERVPDPKSLEPIVAKPIAKQIPLSFPMNPDFRDLFGSLVPIHLSNALASFNAKRVEIMNLEVSRLREATTVLNSLLVSLNLPAAIEDRGGREIPASVAEKANKIKQQGGISSLEKMINDLPNALRRNREILDETNRMLDTEEQSDKELRNQFKERWTRTVSTVLTAPLREEARRYAELIQNATKADRVVQEKYEKNRNSIALLSKQTHEIANELPAASAVGALRDSFVLRDLHRLMDEVEALRAERQVIEMELKNTDTDGTRTRLLAAFQTGSYNDENSVVVNEIDAIYQPLRQQVNQSVSKQEQLVEHIRRAHQQFLDETKGNRSSAMRDEMLRNLASAYDTYQELSSNLREGNKFYMDLTPILMKFQNKVSDFVFARKTEKDDLMKDIQSNILGSSSTPHGSNASSSSNPYASSNNQAEQPPSTYPMPTPTGPFGHAAAAAPPPAALPYPNPYMQPFFPMPQTYNPYGAPASGYQNPNTPPYPGNAAQPYPHYGAPPYPGAINPPYPQQGYGVPPPSNGNYRK